MALDQPHRARQYVARYGKERHNCDTKLERNQLTLVWKFVPLLRRLDVAYFSSYGNLYADHRFWNKCA